MLISTVLLSAVTNADAPDIVYETVSATATVGLTIRYIKKSDLIVERCNKKAILCFYVHNGEINN